MKTSDLKWLGLSLVAFALVNAATYQREPTDSDDLILSRLSSRVSLVKNSCLDGPTEAPLEQLESCRRDDALSSMTGNGCRWSDNMPRLACRIAGFPVTLLENSRVGGAQDVFVTALTRSLGSLEAVRVFKTAEKLALLLLLFLILRAFSLPAPLLVFIAVSPFFHGLGQITSIYSWVALLYCLCLWLVLSSRSEIFFLGVVCSLAAIYVWISSAITVIPIAVAVWVLRKRPRRAFVLLISAGGFLLCRALVNSHFPLLSSDFADGLLRQPVWVKSKADFLVFGRDLYDMLTLSSDRADLLSRPGIDGSFAFNLGTVAAFLDAGVALMLAASAFLLQGRAAKVVRALVFLYVLSATLFFILGHNQTPTYTFRFEHLALMTLTAAYLSAGDCSRWLESSGRIRLSKLPMVWLWTAALLGCAHWVQRFSDLGPFMTMNAGFFSRFSDHLRQIDVRSPILIHETNGIGMLDVFSGETIRPLYLSETRTSPLESGDSLAEYVLAPWSRLGKGTLLQRNIDFDWWGRNLTQADIEGFAASHSITIKKIEFFPYRRNEGYWVIDFVNDGFRGRFLPKGPG